VASRTLESYALDNIDHRVHVDDSAISVVGWCRTVRVEERRPYPIRGARAAVGKGWATVIEIRLCNINR
jgi:hypothetical protein